MILQALWVVLLFFVLLSLFLAIYLFGVLVFFVSLSDSLPYVLSFSFSINISRIDLILFRSVSPKSKVLEIVDISEGVYDFFSYSHRLNLMTPLRNEYKISS